MSNVVWLVSKEKRDAFENSYVDFIQSLPKEIWKDEDYMPTWDSRLSFPLLQRSFVSKLSNSDIKNIQNLYDTIIINSK